MKFDSLDRNQSIETHGSGALRRGQFLVVGGSALLAACSGGSRLLSPLSQKGGVVGYGSRNTLSVTGNSMTCGSKWLSTVSVNGDNSISIAPLNNNVIPSTTLSINGSQLSINVNGLVNTFTLPNDPNSTPKAFQTNTSDGTLTKFNGAEASATAFDPDGITASVGFLNDGSMGIGVMSNGSTLQTGQWDNTLSAATITAVLQQASQVKSNFGSPTPAPASGNLINNRSIIQNALNKLGNPDSGPTPLPCKGLHCPPPPLLQEAPAGMATCYDLIKDYDRRSNRTGISPS